MERIYVTVRARPLSSEESKTSPWRISGNSIFLSNQPPTKFEFDRVFGDDCKTKDIFEARTKEIVASAVRGFNGTVFAYGQTSSGKTHTMRGSLAEPGIMPLAVHYLFNIIQEDLDREFLVRMSYMEIYNEEINDLLAPDHRKLQVHENFERGIYVAGLKEEIVTSPEQVLDFMEFGESHRHIGQTNMNLYSSRSHTIFRMIIESREKIEDGIVVSSCDAVRVSVLNLVDLAGSERAAKTGSEGLRLKEGSHINKSLMTLGTVIKKLSEGVESQGGHVPYRDSKLTRILQPALGGNANTALICNITLAQIHTDETKCSLQFASRALRVTNCACVNEILTDAALLKRQRKEIEELRSKLLSSHSDHLEEEVLNLRNTLLQSELEKERIALELEEEKKAKAHRERRLEEQAKKIASLSSLVLYSEKDERSIHLYKNKRRVTWCPTSISRKCNTEESSSNEESMTGGFSINEQDMDLLPPFEELIQKNEVAMDDLHNDSHVVSNFENKDKWDELSLPDAHSLFHVTRRRKLHLNKSGSLLGSMENQSGCENHVFQLDLQNTQNIGSERPTCKHMESDSCPGSCTSSSIPQVDGSSSHGCVCLLPIRQTEASLVMKQLEDQISSLGIEKNMIQRNLDNVVEMVTEQNASREKYEEELNVASFLKVLTEVQEIVLQIEHSKSVVQSILFFVRDLFQNFSNQSEMLLGLKSFAAQHILQAESIFCGHRKITSYLEKRTSEVELEKNQLDNQLVVSQNKIDELKCDLAKQEKTMTDKCVQLDLEKDELLYQVLTLQKEVSCLSSSSMARERETLRKELDKAKVKLRDTDSKLRNTMQEKVKLESEKAHAEREIKQLHGQRAILERDSWKRDSVSDRRYSKSLDPSKQKGPLGMQEQDLQNDYEKLQVRAFEMEAEIDSLKESLMTTLFEKNEAFARNETLESDLEAISNKSNAADLEISLLQAEISKMSQRLDESESFSKHFENSLNLLSREKEEMAMQLTDALLEVEAEKSLWSAKEKAYVESNGRLKISNEEVSRLCNDLLEARHELASSREQCSLVNEEFAIYKENVQRDQMQGALATNKEKTKLRVQLCSTQAKLDAFRGRYQEMVDEVKLMDKKYKEASSKYKEKLRWYGEQLLESQKLLANRE